MSNMMQSSDQGMAESIPIKVQNNKAVAPDQDDDDDGMDQDGGFANSIIISQATKSNDKNIQKQESKNSNLDGCEGVQNADTIIYRQRVLPYDPFHFKQNLDFDELVGQLEQFISSQSTGESELILEPIILQNGLGGSTVSYQHQIGTKGAIIGRQKTASIVLDSEVVSGLHSEISYRNRQFFIRDTKSTSGTFVRVKGRKKQLVLGSIFEIGTNELMVKDFQGDSNKCICTFEFAEGLPQYKGKSTKLEIEEGKVFMIGKSQQCNWPILQDDKLGDYHANLIYSRGELTIEDLNSENGTWFRLSQTKEESNEYPIEQGTEIKINPFVFRAILK